MRIFQPRFAAMLPIVVLVIVSSIISSTSPAVAQAPSLPRIQSSVICGQVKFATVGSVLNPVLLPFDNSGIALWQPQTFNQDAFYRIVNPQIAVLNPPLQSAEFGSISRQIVGWSSYVQIAGPNDCNLPSRASLTLEVTAPGQLSVVNGHYAPDPFTVEATITNTGPVIATDVSIIFNLPDSLNATITTPGYDTTNPNLGNLAIGQQIHLSWSVKTDFLDTSQATTLGYSITVSASNADSLSIDRETSFPAIPPPIPPTNTPLPPTSPPTNTPLPPTSVPSEIPTAEVPLPAATDTQTPVSQILSSISGRVTTSDGSGLPDVQITITDAVGKKVNSGYTAANGEYKISDLPPGVYIVTPSLDGYTFMPPSADPATVPPKVEHQKFVGVLLSPMTVVPSVTLTAVPIETAIPSPIPTIMPLTQVSPSVTPTRTKTPTPRALVTPSLKKETTRLPSTTVTGVETATLKIVAIDMNPEMPVQGEPVEIRLTLINDSGTPLAQGWDFSGEITLYDSRNNIIKPIHYFERDQSNFVSYAGNIKDLPKPQITEKWTITLEHVYFWKGLENAKMLVVIHPKDSKIPPTSISQAISIKPNPLQGVRCTALAASVISSVAELLPGGSAVSKFSTAMDAVLSAATVKGTSAADAKTEALAVVTVGQNFLKDQGVIGVKNVITIMKEFADGADLITNPNEPTGARECGNGAIWVVEMVKSFMKQGVPLQIQAVHSPAYILITNQQGKRTGFLDDGTIIEEILDSKVLVLGETKLVLYPVQPVTTRLKGTGTGIMTVDLIQAFKENNVQELNYSRIPVTSSMVAIIDGSDVQQILKIDTNGDGIADSFRSPDITSLITVTQIANPSAILKETDRAQAVAGTSEQVEVGVSAFQSSSIGWFLGLVTSIILAVGIIIYRRRFKK